jgi:putative PIN family toxin of toxin-antitoxin system
MSARADRVRVVFDCNTLIQAMGYPAGPAGRCMEMVERAEVELCISRRILAEVRDVLTYERIRAMSERMTDAWIDEFMQRMVFRAVLVRGVKHLMDFPRDPKDEIYIDLAASAKADYLATSDKDLLSLMVDHTVAGKQFRRGTHPWRVVTPAAFLRDIQRRRG